MLPMDTFEGFSSMAIISPSRSSALSRDVDIIASVLMMDEERYRSPPSLLHNKCNYPSQLVRIKLKDKIINECSRPVLQEHNSTNKEKVGSR
jgi:hypothetical protein